MGRFGSPGRSSPPISDSTASGRSSVSAHNTCNEFDGPPMLTIGSVSMGGRLMRGRRPEKLTFARRDADALSAAAHSGPFLGFRVRRAKLVLAIAAGEHQSSVAARLECNQ